MPEEAEQPVLLVEEGRLAKQRWILRGEELIIGRGEQCDVILPERPISRRHARIWREGNQYLLEDLDSRNGTFVNGQAVTEPRPLQDGDQIQLAFAVKLAFIGAEATLPLNAVPELAQREWLRLDKASHRVWIGEREMSPPLSPAQYRLLELLYEGKGRVCSRDEIVAAVWPDELEAGISEQAIDALVRRLRDRMTNLDPDHQYVVTVRGHGFRLENRTG